METFQVISFCGSIHITQPLYKVDWLNEETCSHAVGKRRESTPKCSSRFIPTWQLRVPHRIPWRFCVLTYFFLFFSHLLYVRTVGDFLLWKKKFFIRLDNSFFFCQKTPTETLRFRWEPTRNHNMPPAFFVQESEYAQPHQVPKPASVQDCRETTWENSSKIGHSCAVWSVSENSEFGKEKPDTVVLSICIRRAV